MPSESVPTSPGVYAWYFDAPVPLIDSTGCHRIDGRGLLYVGISPKAPSLKGLPPSRSTLRKRILTHYRGNAEGSTLRQTLGCLLSFDSRSNYDGLEAAAGIHSQIPVSRLSTAGWTGMRS